MSDIYIKEMPDNTITLVTGSGYIIGKFDDIDDANDICDWPNPTETTTHSKHVATEKRISYS